MTVPLDEITRRKLILVRQLYQRAMVQSEVLHSDFDRIMSLIAFDLASETVLKAVVATLEPSKTADKDFQAIIQQADALLLKKGLPEVPYKPKIQHVHGLRNDAQHKAKYPNNNDVSDSRTYTRDFLQQLVLKVWGEDFNAIKMTDLIKHPIVKKHLLEAETKLEEKDYWNAAVQAVAGFGAALGRVKAAVLGSLPGNNWMEMMPMKEVLILPIIGLDYPSYAKYKQYTMHIHVNRFADGGISCNNSGYEPTPDETAFIVTYAINSIIQIESLAGNLDKPFDSDNTLLGKFV